MLVFTGTFLAQTAWCAETKEICKATIDSSGVQEVEMLAGIKDLVTDLEKTAQRERPAGDH